MQSLRSQLLIAPAHLADPNFTHSVVLILDHNGEGALGVVLNRRTRKTIRDVWQDVRQADCTSNKALYAGGPVPGPLVALHSEPDWADTEILPGLFFTSDAEHIEALVEADPEPVRFYAGYAGWGEGQLEGELQTGSWLTTLAESEDIFIDDEDALWRRVFRRASGGNDAFPRDATPFDPGMN